MAHAHFEGVGMKREGIRHVRGVGRNGRRRRRSVIQTWGIDVFSKVQPGSETPVEGGVARPRSMMRKGWWFWRKRVTAELLRFSAVVNPKMSRPRNAPEDGRREHRGRVGAETSLDDVYKAAELRD